MKKIVLNVSKCTLNPPDCQTQSSAKVLQIRFDKCKCKLTFTNLTQLLNYCATLKTRIDSDGA